MEDNKIVELFIKRDEAAIKEVSIKYGSKLNNIAKIIRSKALNYYKRKNTLKRKAIIVELSKELEECIAAPEVYMNLSDSEFGTLISNFLRTQKYAEEFAGTAIGDVYMVNGISLNTGKDLFGDRLKLEGNYDYIKYLTQDNWDNGWPNYNYLDLKDITQVDIDAYIKELYNGEFVSMENSNIYDNPSHHIFVYMKDKTRVELRLFEGSYVGYQALGWYFVKMPGDIFEKIYSATK